MGLLDCFRLFLDFYQTLPLSFWNRMETWINVAYIHGLFYNHNDSSLIFQRDGIDRLELFSRCCDHFFRENRATPHVPKLNPVGFHVFGAGNRSCINYGWSLQLSKILEPSQGKTKRICLSAQIIRLHHSGYWPCFRDDRY